MYAAPTPAGMTWPTHTETQRHGNTATRKHRSTEIQRHSDTETQSHNSLCVSVSLFIFMSPLEKVELFTLARPEGRYTFHTIFYSFK